VGLSAAGALGQAGVELLQLLDMLGENCAIYRPRKAARALGAFTPRCRTWYFALGRSLGQAPWRQELAARFEEPGSLGPGAGADMPSASRVLPW